MELIEVIRDQIGRSPIDFGAAMGILNRIPRDIRARMDPIVVHAREAVAAAPGGDGRHEGVARYALARLLIALETERSREAADRDGSADQVFVPPSR